MKKLLLMLCLALCSMGVAHSQSSQRVTQEGKVFSLSSSKESKTTQDTLITDYEFKDSKGVPRSIVVNLKTGACWCPVVSKSGNYYRKYLPMEVRQKVWEALGLTFPSSASSKKDERTN